MDGVLAVVSRPFSGIISSSSISITYRLKVEGRVTFLGMASFIKIPYETKNVLTTPPHVSYWYGMTVGYTIMLIIIP